MKPGLHKTAHVSGHAIEHSANVNWMTIIADFTNFLFTHLNNLTPYEMD
jgi:hypothetical protein